MLQRCFSLTESGRFSFVEKEGKSVRERIRALDTQKTLVVLWSDVKSIYISPVTDLQRSTNSEQPHSMVHHGSPRLRRLVFCAKTFPETCFRGDRKMTMGGLHGRKMVPGTGVGVSMVPGGRVIHHQQRCRAQQRVVPTITQLS